MLSVACDHCGSRFRASEEYAGRKAKCPKCQNVFRLPEAAAPTLPTFVSPVTDDIPRHVVAVAPPVSSETKDAKTSNRVSEGETTESNSTLLRLGLSVAIGVAWLYSGWSFNELLGLAASGVALMTCSFTVWLMHRYGAIEKLSLSRPAGWALLLLAKPFVVLFGPVGVALLLSWCGGPRRRNSIYNWSTGAQSAILAGAMLVFIGSIELEQWGKRT